MSTHPDEHPLAPRPLADLEMRLARAESRASLLRRMAGEAERAARDLEDYARELRAAMAAGARQ